jgi:2,4-dienoyl-CoA reductase-like NADH-dependent reductase (Old Yellow Enzyme family)/thioredoxin reductase
MQAGLYVGRIEDAAAVGKERQRMTVDVFRELFRPGRINRLELKNRFIMAAAGNAMADDEGFVADRAIDYCVERAKGGVGLVIVKFTSVIANARGSRNHMAAFDDKFIPRLRDLSIAVQRHGARVALQLGHHGNDLSLPRRQSGFSPGEQPVVAPSPVPYVATGVIPKPLSREEISELVKAFAQACRRAKEAGFDAVEFHGAHGYLISQFLSPYYNRRADEYGGSPEKRARFGAEILMAARREVGPHFPLIMRMDGWDGYEGGLVLEEAVKVAPLFVEAGADALHVSAGAREAVHWQFLSYLQESAGLVHLAEAVKKVVNIPVITVGKLGDPVVAEQVLKQGRADFIALARPLIADPHLVRKVQEGRPEEIRSCIYCSNCLGESYKGWSCMLNPGVLREREFEIKPAPRSKRVMVAGGGLAGMEAAKVCAQRGHQVTLYEKSNALGGQWNIACLQEHKGHFATVTRRLREEMDKAGVRVHLNTEVTHELVEKQNPDAVIVATGAAPASLHARGAEGGNVVQANDVICGTANVGDKVVIIGGRYVGMEVAITLAQKGKNVSLLTRRKVGRNVRKNIRLLLMDRLIENGVKLYADSEAVDIRPDGVAAVCEGNLFFLKADTVILAVGATPESTLIEALKSRVLELHAVGDCVEPRDALAAVKQGAEVGRIV